MAVGDQALAAGYDIVPDTGEEGRVRWGGREINRTRDYAAAVKATVPVGKAAFQTASGISYGTTLPPTAADGDIFFLLTS